VVRVSPGSHAEEQGVKPGARVVAISGEAVSTLDDFKRLVTKCRERGERQCTVEYEPFEETQLSKSGAAAGVNSSAGATAGGGGGGAIASDDLEDEFKSHATISQQNDPAMKSALESRKLWQEARKEVMRARKTTM
jgi:hypothetical protein